MIGTVAQLSPNARKVLDALIRLTPAWPGVVEHSGGEEAGLKAMHELFDAGLLAFEEGPDGYRLITKGALAPSKGTA